jgi:hypothetical protein
MDSHLSDSLRVFWLKGINTVQKFPEYGFREWLIKGSFQFDNVINPSTFVLSCLSNEKLLSSIAHDISRLSMVSFETMEGIIKISYQPKSNGWLIIKAYYAAFFSALAILHILGVVCSQLNNFHIKNLKELSSLYLSPNNQFHPSSGMYKISIGELRLCFENISTNSGGAHEKLWKIFLKEIEKIILKLSKIKDNRAASEAFMCLTTIKDNLIFQNNRSGGWLTSVRNSVNYRHEHGVWFPYQGYKKKYHGNLIKLIEKWKENHLSISTSDFKGKDLKRFIETCCAITAVNRSILLDINNRCSTNNSFVSGGVLKLLLNVKRQT